MSLKDYCKPRDCFELGNEGVFPCDMCKSNMKQFNEEPCIRGDHNVNAVKEKEPAKGCECIWVGPVPKKAICPSCGKPVKVKEKG